MSAPVATALQQASPAASLGSLHGVGARMSPQQSRRLPSGKTSFLTVLTGPQGARLPSSRSKTNEDTVAMATADSCLPDARGTSLSMKLALRSADGGTEKSKSLKIHRDIGLIEFEVSLTPHKICSYVNR